MVNLHGSQYDDISNFFVSYALLSILIPAVKYLRDARGVSASNVVK